MQATELRGYQARAVHKAKVLYSQGKRRFIIYGPTGSGKTVLAEAFIRSAASRGKRVAFVANRVGLVGQASKHLTRAGIPHGIIQGENTRDTDELVLVCSIQTLVRRRWPVGLDVIVIDEAHGVPGSSQYKKFIFDNNALPVIGLSATPFAKGMGKRHSELEGEPLFEDMIVSATIRELIEQGFLVDCDIYAPSEPDLSGLKLTRNQFGELDYDEKKLGDAVDKPQLIGDIVKHWKAMAGGKPTVCFATNITHSKHIVECFRGAGVAAEHIDCYTDEDERAAILARVASGETTVISNVGILTEGWDFPACEVMILARPTKSLIRWIQMAGRILRPFAGKLRGMILDHSGSTHSLGYPTDDLPLELDVGAPNTSGSRADEKEEKKPTKCPACTFMKPAGVHKCPKCGFAPERQNTIQTADGKLSLVERKAAKFSMDEKQAIFAALLGYAAGKDGIKKKDAWAYYKYREIVGVFPVNTKSAKPGPMVDVVRRYMQRDAIAYRAGKAKEAPRAAA